MPSINYSFNNWREKKMNSLGFNPSVSAWMVAVSLLLFVFLFGLEIRKKNKFRVARLIALVGVGISLMGFLLRPFYEERSKEEVFLLTPGYSADRLDSISKIHPQLKWMRTTDVEEVKKASLADAEFLEKKSASIRYVAGEGLSAADLETMTPKNFQFLPATPGGVVKLLFPDAVIENHRATLRGLFVSEENTVLRLAGPAGVEDSVRVEKGTHPFALSFHPKQSGRFVYQLEVQQGKEVYREPLPVEVQPETPLRILVLQKFPTAEIKNLKNFLAERKHALTLRYQISKVAYSYEYVNAKETKIAALSQNLLQSFDLLVIDGGSLESLTGGERASLRKAIQEGLGVVVTGSEHLPKLKWFWSLQFNPSSRDTAHVVFRSGKKYTLPVLPFTVSASQDIYPAGQGLTKQSGYVMQGRGRVAFQLLQETYRLRAEGNESDYAETWSDLVEAVSRRQQTDHITLTTAFPFYEREPVEVQLISKEAPSLQADSIMIPAKEDEVLDDVWRARWWAGKAGWHELKTAKASHYYYVAPEGSWKSLRAANRISATQQVAGAPAPAGSDMLVRQPVPLLWFFLLFLLAAGFLWLAPKL
jgi:hypothetical protein